ncbi:MAG: hypothetical protein OXE84_06675 [Rhodobacteraceae bacterium]|nr:hypothetical protein [Paracoccaceae bacterium]MCY4197580.1 hypothetical protein [Paracoccaceae bacterium]
MPPPIADPIEVLVPLIQEDGTFPDHVEAPYNYWHEPWFLCTYLRPDHQFCGPIATTAFVYDAECVDSIICHKQAGCARKASPAELSRLWVQGTTGDPHVDDRVILDVLAELPLDDLITVFTHSGACPRDIARVYRQHPHRITYPVFIALNQWSDIGPKELPRMYVKEMFTEYDGGSRAW